MAPVLNTEMLEAHDITVKYGSRLAVSEVSLTLKPHRVTAIIGPNGAGKSTMLRTLNGGFAPAAGRITLDNRPLDSYSRRAIAKRIAVVAQEADLRFPVTVFEFVLGGRYARSSTGGLGLGNRTRRRSGASGPAGNTTGRA